MDPSETAGVQKWKITLTVNVLEIMVMVMVMAILMMLAKIYLRLMKSTMKILVIQFRMTPPPRSPLLLICFLRQLPLSDIAHAMVLAQLNHDNPVIEIDETVQNDGSANNTAAGRNNCDDPYGDGCNGKSENDSERLCTSAPAAPAIPTVPAATDDSIWFTTASATKISFLL